MARVVRYRCLDEALADYATNPVRLCGIGNVLDPLSSRIRGLFEPGLTVREYVQTLWPMLSPGLEVNVAIDGEYIGKDDWALARYVQPGQSLVVSLVPKGGGGGGKNIFATVAMLALAVVAPVVAPYLVGAMGITAASVGAIGVSIATSLVSTGIMVGGALLISAFVGTGATSRAISATSSTDESPTWSDAPNPVTEGGPWPVIYGTVRLTPVTLGWFKEYDGEDQYLCWMGAVADHAVTSIDDIFINDNPLSFYDNVTVEKRLGTLDQEPISYFEKTISEKTVNMRLSTDYVTARTDGNTCQGLGFILCFPQGLAYISDSGSYAETSVAINMQYRRVGDTDWTDFATETIKDSTGSALYKLFRAEHISDDGAQYDLRVKFATAPSTATRYRTMCYFAGIQEIVYDKFSYPGRALFGLRIKANDLLNSSTSLTIECLVSRTTVQVYDGEIWLAKDATIPAWAAWDFQTNTDYGGCTPAKRIVFEDFAAWAEWLDTMPLYRVNICMDSVSTHQSWMEQVAMLGRGAVVQIGSKFTCIVDRPVDTPSGGVLFGVGNILKDTFEIKYLSTEERANCIEVTYKDKDANYSKQTLSWYGQDYNTSPEQTKTTQVTLLGCDNTEQALRHAEYLLKKNRYLTLTASFGAALNALGVQPGDVIPVGHDLPQWGYGGRIVSATGDDTSPWADTDADVWTKDDAGLFVTTTSTVVIDRDVTMEPGTSYALQVQLSDDQVLEYPLVGVTETTTTRTLTVEGGWREHGMPQRHDPYQFGPCTRVSKLFKVLTIQQTDDFTYSLECLEYNEGVYDDSVTVPEVTNISDLASVDGLVAVENWAVSDGIGVAVVDLAWRGVALSWIVSYRLAGGSWVNLGSTRYTSFSVKNLIAGREYAFRVSADGKSEDITLTFVGRPSMPDGPSDVAATLMSTGMQLSWTLDQHAWVTAYDIAVDGVVIAQGYAGSSYVVTQLSTGTHTLSVRGRDLWGQTGPWSDAQCLISGPAAPAVVVSLIGTAIRYDLTPPASDLAVVGYQVRLGAAWESAEAVGTITGTTATMPVTGVGQIIRWFAAIDVAGNVGTPATASITISTPSAPMVTASISGSNILVSWVHNVGSLPLASSEILHGSTLATAASLGSGLTNTSLQVPGAAGTHRFWVRDTDAVGATGPAGMAELVITAPGAVVITPQVIDNNVLLSWTEVAGTLPIADCELRRGATYATSALIGRISGRFSTIFESIAGAFTYWITQRDIAGNDGTPSPITVQVSEPPDYVLHTDIASTFSGTRTNSLLANGMLLMPVDTTSTVSARMAAGGWASRQAKVAAGYPYRLEPTPSGASYQETIDYGTTLTGTKITVTKTAQIVHGSVVLICNLKISADGSTWTDLGDVWSAYGVSFRYVRVTITATPDGGSNDLIQLIELRFRLDSKLKNDAGSATCSASDTGGTQVNFNAAFVDVQSITLTPASGGSARYALYDFEDTPNPVGFKILLYDASGNRVSGTCSWSVKGV